MSSACHAYPFRDLRSLPRTWVRVSAGAVAVAVTFRDTWDGRTLMAALRAKLGEALLTELLVARMRSLGQLGRPHAMLAWRLTGLPYHGRARIGRRLQRLLEDMDEWVSTQGLSAAAAEIRIRADGCELSVQGGVRLRV
jgi:hypothetical protein